MDVERIKALVELMTENALTEVIIRDGESRLVLRRGGIGGSPQFASSPAMQMQAPFMVPSPAAPPRPADPDAGLVAIKSPMVGTFYSASKPDVPPFVQVGSTIGPDTVVCIIEAMKVFNEIKAEISGTIERVAAANGGPVEFNQPLFWVRPPA